MARVCVMLLLSAIGVPFSQSWQERCLPHVVQEERVKHAKPIAHRNLREVTASHPAHRQSLSPSGTEIARGGGRCRRRCGVRGARLVDGVVPKMHPQPSEEQPNPL